MNSLDYHIVLDLDDTLYKEIDYVRSAYFFINNYLKNSRSLDLSDQIEKYANERSDFFSFINSHLQPERRVTIEKYLELYRFHYPSLIISKNTKKFIQDLNKRKIGFSVLTDGRSITQRNKLHSLGIYFMAENIIISEETGFEKPAKHNFEIIQNFYPDKKLIYIGDNTSKDFLAPNFMNWDTYCLLDNGSNIHKQDFNLDEAFLPKYILNDINDLL